MSVALVAARLIYFAALLQLFGLLALGLLFEPAPHRRWTWALIALVLIAMSGWLALEAHAMSGESVSLDTVRAVLQETRFGELWIARAGLLIAAALVPWRGAATMLVGLALVITAAPGHAGATGSALQTSADAIHLLAVGAWLGGLAPFSKAIMRPRPLAATERDARRFSRLGAICAALILATGGINGWYLVGNLHALVGTGYGRLLVLKITLFAAMITVAAVNRWRLIPLLASGIADAVPRLQCNALIETGLGVAIVAIVAMLGTMAPAYYMIAS
jgi:copper resistance protein D